MSIDRNRALVAGPKILWSGPHLFRLAHSFSQHPSPPHLGKRLAILCFHLCSVTSHLQSQPLLRRMQHLVGRRLIQLLSARVLCIFRLLLSPVPLLIRIGRDAVEFGLLLVQLGLLGLVPDSCSTSDEAQKEANKRGQQHIFIPSLPQ